MSAHDLSRIWVGNRTRVVVHATALFVLLIGGEEESCDEADT